MSCQHLEIKTLHTESGKFLLPSKSEKIWQVTWGAFPHEAAGAPQLLPPWAPCVLRAHALPLPEAWGSLTRGRRAPWGM